MIVTGGEPVERLLTVPEVAERLQLQPRTIHRHLKEGKLEGALFGREWRVTEEALVAYVEAAKEAARAGRGKRRKAGGDPAGRP
jgi:excisionase family DNA binding protein